MVIATLAVGWTAFGTVYYNRMLPFYDSLAYQEGFVRVVQRSNEISPWKAMGEVWRESSNVALFKFFAALFGRFVPTAREGLFLYLFGIHFAGILALIAAVRGSTGALSLGIYAAAAWIAARPFNEAINGVLDQRMDLASGSFYLIVAALFLSWARKPTRWGAVLAGSAAALAVLHRPVMVVGITGVGAIFMARAALKHELRARSWATYLGLILLPGMLITAPWLFYHARDLQLYYLIWNVDVGSANSMADAAGFNLRWFGWGTGTIYPLLIGAVMAWGLLKRRVDWLDFFAVLACLALPLALLATSRSVGNVLVSQLSLGMPALVVACIRPSTQISPLTRVIGPGIAASALVLMSGHSLYALGAQVAGVPTGPRWEVVQMLRQLEREIGTPRRIISGFQSFPLDTVGLAAVSRQEGINVEAGPSFFHPMDFGISNEDARTISDEHLRLKVADVLLRLTDASAVLLVATADTEAQLPPAHFSQTHTRAIRAAVEADSRFVRQYTTSAIRGVKFDVYVVNPVNR